MLAFCAATAAADLTASSPSSSSWLSEPGDVPSDVLGGIRLAAGRPANTPAVGGDVFAGDAPLSHYKLSLGSPKHERQLAATSREQRGNTP